MVCNLYLLARYGFGAPNATDQTSQTKDVIEVAVREQGAGEIFKPSFGSFDLALGSFAAIN